MTYKKPPPMMGRRLWLYGWNGRFHFMCVLFPQEFGIYIGLKGFFI